MTEKFRLDPQTQLKKSKINISVMYYFFTSLPSSNFLLLKLLDFLVFQYKRFLRRKFNHKHQFICRNMFFNSFIKNSHKSLIAILYLRNVTRFDKYQQNFIQVLKLTTFWSFHRAAPRENAFTFSAKSSIFVVAKPTKTHFGKS